MRRWMANRSPLRGLTTWTMARWGHADQAGAVAFAVASGQGVAKGVPKGGHVAGGQPIDRHQ